MRGGITHGPVANWTVPAWVGVVLIVLGLALLANWRRVLAWYLRKADERLARMQADRRYWDRLAGLSGEQPDRARRSSPGPWSPDYLGGAARAQAYILLPLLIATLLGVGVALVLGWDLAVPV